MIIEPGSPLRCPHCARSEWGVWFPGVLRCGGRKGCRAVYAVESSIPPAPLRCAHHRGAKGLSATFELLAGDATHAAQSICHVCRYARPLAWPLDGLREITREDFEMRINTIPPRGAIPKSVRLGPGARRPL